ncbi:TIR domain-containing protein [Streptomyces sp. NBC_01351]|uniref:toll/interleukin-1 receptor domain-containing protein n=1 Tax=Streptomyces sp. NBC_01351 TaxID=2903833 RepID=UPI002E32A6FD|nr:TIR domain-containing protein [Streptomyces sp. NBC_01351]
MDERQYRRDAFISYSHQQDVPLAQALQRGLHRLGRPWTRRQTVSVFRDTTSLAASSDLGGAILKELADSRYFIYVASPAAAQSRWVREEIEFWIEHCPMDRFLIAVSDGTIAWDPSLNDWDWSRTTCLPEVLRGKFAKEPLWVDLTAVRAAEEFSLRDAPLRDAVATLLAPLRGRTKDEIDSEDLRQRRTALRMLRGAVTALSFLLVTALIAGFLAWQQRNEALARARTSASLALAARALEMAATDPRRSAQYALYAYATEPTGEAAQALARAVAGNDKVSRHMQGGNEAVADWRSAGNRPPTVVAVSRDGSTMAYYTAFDTEAKGPGVGYVHLYDIRSGKALPSLDGEGWPLSGGPLQLSADGRVLAVAVWPNRIELWDVPQARLMRTIAAGNRDGLSNATMGFRAFALSPDGQRLAAAFHSMPVERDVHIAVWDTASGTPVSEGYADSIWVELAFRDANQLVAVDGGTRTVRTLDGNTWSEPSKLPGLPTPDASADEPGGMVLSDDWDMAYVTSPYEWVDGAKVAATAELWDLAAARRLASVPGGDIRALALPRDNNAMVVGDARRGVTLYDTALRQRRILGAFQFPLLSMATSGDGQWVAAGTEDGAISLFSTASLQGGADVPNEDQLKATELTPDQSLAFRGKEGGTDLWTVADTGVQRLGHIGTPVVRDGNTSDDVIANGDGSRVVVEKAGTLTLWDPKTGAQIGSPAVDSPVNLPLFFLPDGIHLVGAGNGGISVTDTRTWKVVQEVPGTGSYESSSVSGDRKTLVLQEREAVTVLRVTKGNRLKQVHRTKEVTKEVMKGELAVSHSGDKVATIDGDNRITILDVASGRTVRSSAVSIRDGQRSVVFNRDSRFVVQVVGTGKDATFQFWDAETGESRGTWAVETQVVGAQDTVQMFTAPNGAILTFGADGSLMRRTIDIAAWREVLCKVGPDPLPRNEYDRYLKGMDVKTPCRPDAKE